MRVPTQAILGTRDNRHHDEFTCLDADEVTLVKTREPQYWTLDKGILSRRLTAR